VIPVALEEDSFTLERVTVVTAAPDVVPTVCDKPVMAEEMAVAVDLTSMAILRPSVAVNLTAPSEVLNSEK
jgi:hypothetical protein